MSTTPAERWTRVGLLLCLGWYLLQAGYFVARIDPAVAPDHAHHLQLVETMHQFGFFVPLERVDPYLATTSRNFFVYHWLLSFFVPLAAPLGLALPTLLRLLNVLLGLPFFWFVFKGSKLALGSAPRALWAVFLLSNVLMLSFLFSSISWDNLINLCAAGLIYHLFRYAKEREPGSLFGVFAWLGFGCLVKAAFFPLALLSLLVLAWDSRADFRGAWRSAREAFARATLARRALVATVLGLLLCANVALHGRAFVLYGKLSPRCADVVAQASCLQKHPIIEKYALLAERLGERRDLLLDPIHYAFTWADYMIEKSLGIFGYASFYQGRLFLGVVELFLLFALLRLARILSQRDKLLLYGAFIATSFAMVLIAWVNFPTYQRFHVLPRYTFIAVQGRYLFGVLPLIVMLVAHAFASVERRWWRLGLGVTLSLLLWVGGFPTFVLDGGPGSLTDNGILQWKYQRLLHGEQDFVHP